MDSERTVLRDLSAIVVPQAGRLAVTADRWEPCRLVDGDGARVDAVSPWFEDLMAAGRSASTVRSYGMDLLRWFRFLWAVGVTWDRATRLEARDFSRWLQVTGNQVRPHWRQQHAMVVGAEPAVVAVGRPYAASVRAHSETVLRSFYDFHRDAGTGPILNPFPLQRSRLDRRAHAHQNPMEPARNERVGRYRPTVAARIPRSVPAVEFNEIFAIESRLVV